MLPTVVMWESDTVKLSYCAKGKNHYMSEKILVVDDEHDIADLLEVYLQNENYIIYKYYSAKEALDCIENKEIDLAILDIMLPDINGFSLCQKIREKYTYPIIMLTAKDEETDKITGLTLGADDYVTKPFRPLELIARVKAQLRRYNKYTPSPVKEVPATIFTYKKLSLNTQTYECALEGKIIPLTPTEFSILRILLENQGVVVSLEDLFHSVWKDEYYSKNSSTITVHIRHLREKLKDTAEKPKYIKTIWGVGYKI
jgi:two-component system response regulator VanR